MSSVFLVPKPNGQKRFILNLKPLNKFVYTSHFKLEDYRTSLKLISRDCYMASVDLKDAYFLINIKQSHRKYLRFKYNNILYEFNCLPFGLCTAPFVFTKILKPVVQFLRSKNLLSVIYLDDMQCFGRTYDECKDNINTTVTVLQTLGFIINYEKSYLIPNTVCQFLGYIFDSRNMVMYLPNCKKLKIMNMLNHFIQLRSCKLREFARLLGLLISACPAIDYSFLYTKVLERYKYLCLLKNPSYEQKIPISNELKVDFEWWRQHINRDVARFRLNNFCTEIFSDASTAGWGAFCNGVESHGFWKDDEYKQHINELEIRAAFFGLQTFAKDLTNCEILLRIDNITAISCLNRMGSVRFPHLNSITRQIWQWCEERKILIFASYINTKDNSDADRLSRKKFNDTEWELADYAFQEIKRKLGSPEIDLFATRRNTKCPCFISWRNDPEAWAVDAFTVPWQDRMFYAFPPFALILKTIQKIINDKAEGIIVVPFWPTQPWFPLFQKITVSNKVIHFDPDINLLNSPFRQPHNLHRSLHLIAAKLSGKLY